MGVPKNKFQALLRQHREDDPFVVALAIEMDALEQRVEALELATVAGQEAEENKKVHSPHHSD